MAIGVAPVMNVCISNTRAASTSGPISRWHEDLWRRAHGGQAEPANTPIAINPKAMLVDITIATMAVRATIRRTRMSQPAKQGAAASRILGNERSWK